MNKHKNNPLGKCGIVSLAVALLISSSSGLYANTMTSNTQTLDFGQSVPLIDLVEGELSGIIIGDKLFEGFVYSATNEMPDADNVNVMAIQDNAGNLGIRFQGAFVDSPDIGGAGDQIASDAHIGFSVLVLDQNYRISDAHLRGNISLDEDPTRGGSFGQVDEDFLDNDPATDKTMQIFNSTFGAGGHQFEDWVLFDARYERLDVKKDIYAKASHLAIKPVLISLIDQTFSQEQVVVPEPATAMLMLAGGLAMTGIRRRK